MRSYFFSFLGFFCALLSAVNVFAGEEVKSPQFTLTDTFVSRYIWRGIDLYPDNDGAHQPSVDVTFKELVAGSDLSLNVWASFPCCDGHQDAEEVDYSLNLSRDLTEKLSVAGGLTYFDYTNTHNAADAVELWAQGDFTLPAEIVMTLFAAYDFEAKSKGPDDGLYYSWGFSREFALSESPASQPGQTITLSVTNWGTDGAYDFKPCFLYATELSVATTYKVGSFDLTPSLNYSIGYEEQINNGDEELWGGIEVKYAF